MAGRDAGYTAGVKCAKALSVLNYSSAQLAKVHVALGQVNKVVELQDKGVPPRERAGAERDAQSSLRVVTRFRDAWRAVSGEMAPLLDSDIDDLERESNAADFQGAQESLAALEAAIPDEAEVFLTRVRKLLGRCQELERQTKL